MGSSKCFRFTQWELKQRCEQCWKIFGVWSEIEAHLSRLYLWKAPCWPYVAHEHRYVTKDHGGKPLRGLELATNPARLTCGGQLGMIFSQKRPWTKASLNQPNSLPIIACAILNQPALGILLQFIKNKKSLYEPWDHSGLLKPLKFEPVPASHSDPSGLRPKNLEQAP